MRSFALLLGFYITTCRPEYSIKEKNLRIINGIPIPIDMAPYQTAIEKEGEHDCAGVIIARDIILTAAHCVKHPDKGNPIMNLVQESPLFYRIRVGNDYKSIGGQLHKIKEWIVHEKYHSRNNDFDVALIKLIIPLNYTKTIQAIEVASEEPKPGNMAMVTGFGLTTPSKKNEDKKYWQPLMNITIPIVDRKKCQGILKMRVTKNMLCAGYLDHRIDDACQGDSGGPMIVNGKVAGVTSWGIGCGRKGLPGVYTNIVMFSDWIEKAQETLNKKNTIF